MGKLEEQDFLRRYQYLSVSGRLRRMNSSTYYFSDCKTEKNNRTLKKKKKDYNRKKLYKFNK